MSRKKEAPRIFKAAKKVIKKNLEKLAAVLAVFSLLFILAAINLASAFDDQLENRLENKKEFKKELKAIAASSLPSVSGKTERILLSRIDSASSQEADSEIVSSTDSALVDSSFWSSFGDNFSSAAYLDLNKTGLVLDEAVTALSFPPKYRFNLEKRCIDEFCGEKDFKKLTAVDFVQPGSKPAELNGKNIVYSRLDKLEKLLVASYIVLENGEERVYAYFFDSKGFSPIISPSGSEKMITEYGRGGGEVVVSGADDDFIILYIGYEGRAFHYRSGKLNDISRFFGLRVADGGFLPQIVKQGEGEDSLWYVIGVGESGLRLIKLWQNGGEEIVGAYDFSQSLKNSFTPLFFRENGRGSFDFIFKEISRDISGQEIPLSNSYLLWSFRDSGFDNSSGWTALSAQLNNQSALVIKAKIKEAGISGTCSLQLSNNGQDFFPVEIGQVISFPEKNRFLYWKIFCPASSSSEYSPWIDHINFLDYYLGLKD